MGALLRRRLAPNPGLRSTGDKAMIRCQSADKCVTMSFDATHHGWPRRKAANFCQNNVTNLIRRVVLDGFRASLLAHDLRGVLGRCRGRRGRRGGRGRRGRWWLDVRREGVNNKEGFGERMNWSSTPRVLFGIYPDRETQTDVAQTHKNNSEMLYIIM